MSSIRQKSPQVKGSSTPDGALTPQESSDGATINLSLESQQKQRRNDRSWAQRFNGTVFCVLFLFAFIYGTVTLCVVRLRISLLRHTASACHNSPAGATEGILHPHTRTHDCFSAWG